MARADLQYAAARERIRQLEFALEALTVEPEAAPHSNAVEQLVHARGHLRACARAVAADHPDLATRLRSMAGEAERAVADLHVRHTG